MIARVTGFGQTGPYASRPGFGTLAEAMSGFAALNGEPDGPPLLPPLALADGVAGLATAFAIMVALRAREHDRARAGRRHVSHRAADDAARPADCGLGPPRRAPAAHRKPLGHNAPRNVYRTADGHWVAVSASATSVAERVLRLVGRADLVEQPWFATGAGRVAHVDEIDGAVAAWIAQTSARRGPRGVRGGGRGDRADLRRARHPRRPAFPGDRHDRPRRRRRLGPVR